MVLQFLGAIQGILVSIFFLSRYRRHLSNLVMGLYVFLFSIGLLETWIDKNTFGLAGKVIQSFVGNSSFLYGPFLYLFVYFLIANPTRLHRKIFIHTIPFLFFFGWDLVTIFGRSSTHTRTEEIIALVAFELFAIQILCYNFAAINTLKKHHRVILETYSSIEKRDLQWLKNLLILITAIYIFSFTLSHLQLLGIRGINELFIIVQVSIVVCIYFMTYRVLFHPELFNISNYPPVRTIKEEMDEGVSPIDPGEKPKYKRSGLKQEQVQEFLGLLHNYMNTEKPYKNPELNIFLLAQAVGISRHHLTQVLNESLKVTFFEFINSYRIKEAQELLLNPDFSHLSLAGIASAAGFKSKTTFFKHFKKVTGSTPQEWVKKERNSNI